MDINKALSEIDEIRSCLAGHTLFQGFGPVAIACTGVLAGLLGIAQQLMPQALASGQMHYLLVWVFATIVASVFITGHMWFRSRALHGTQSGVMLNRLFEQLVPPVFVTLVVTIVFLHSAADAMNALPGIWLLMAALASFAMASSLGNRMRLVGIWYLLSGSTVLALGLQQPETVLSTWLLAIPFMVGQLSMAAVLKLESQ